MQQKVIEVGTCPICSQEAGTLIHMVWNCAASNHVWVECKSVIQKWPNYMEVFHQMWDKVLRNLEQREIERVAITMQNILFWMNDFVFNKKVILPY